MEVEQTQETLTGTIVRTVQILEIVQRCDEFLDQHGIPEAARIRTAANISQAFRAVSLEGQGNQHRYGYTLSIVPMTVDCLQVRLEIADAHAASKQVHVTFCGKEEHRSPPSEEPPPGAAGGADGGGEPAG